MNLNFRRLLPLFAIATGVALVGVTSAFKEAPNSRIAQTTYSFEYTGPSDYAASEVQNVNNWTYVSDSDRCSDINVKACTLFVPEEYVDNPSSSPTLDASINIETAVSPQGTAYVSSTAAGSGQTYISNKAN